MPSFRAINDRFPALLIDAASSEIQVGLLRADGTGTWFASREEASVAVFQGVQHLGLNPLEVSAFIFCDGPGSVLGIRSVAMALRIWMTLKPRPAFAYCSLAIVAHALRQPGVGVIADARRDSWHHYQVGKGLRRVPAAELEGELVMPRHFRHWSPLPAGVREVPYELRELLPKVWTEDVLLETSSPDAFLHEEPSYVKWTPQIHQSPSPR